MRNETLLSPTAIQRILEERARILAQLPEDNNSSKGELELVTFHISNEYIGIPTSQIYETQPLHAHRWTKVPCAPSFIIGIINLRSHIYSIMDLSRFLDLPPHPLTENTHILLVRGGLCADGKEMELTLITDDVPQIQTVPFEKLNHPPDTISAQILEFVQGVTPEMLMILDINRLLSDPRLIIHDVG